MLNVPRQAQRVAAVVVKNCPRSKLGTVTSRLKGLYKVRDMHVDQIVSTATIDNAIAKLESEL